MRSFSTQLSSAILIFACFLLSNRAWSQVAIGTSGSSPTPNSKAVLLLEGNNQGLILPIVSNLTSIGAASSEKGMVVFNSTDNKVYYFDGASWAPVGSGGTGSNLIQISGNTITLGVGASSVNLATGFSNSARGFLYWNGTSWVQAQFTLPSTTQALVYNPGTSSWGFQTLSAGGGITTLSTSGTYLTVANPTGPTATITANPITNTDISATAAIAGSKITPAFGTQNISTTGTLTTGAATVSGLTIGTSVWPANASGVLTNNGTGTLTWAAAPNPTLGGDLTGTAAAATVSRIQGQPVSATVPAAGQVLQFVSGVWTPANLTGGGTVTNVTATAPLNVANGSTTPALSLSPLTDTDISATAAIAGTKINPAFGSQNITTTTGSASIGGGLNVGLANGLQISNAGNFTRINNIATSFPAAQGAANTYLRNDGAGNLSWSTVAGGTDVTTQNGVLTGNGSTISGVASLPVNLGGTGATSLSGLVVGNGTSALTAITTGTNGQVLTVNAGVPSWQNPTTSGAAGGDLTGTYPNPTIATGAVTSTKIATGAVGTTNIAATAVDDSKIANVAPGKILQASATSGQVLKWNGSTWAPAPDAVGGGGAPTLNPGQIIVGDGSTNSGATMSLDASLNSTNGNVTVQGLQGRPISTAVPASNSVYQFNGTQWIPVVLSGGGTVSSIATGTGLTGGPITGTGTISIAPGGVTSTELATGAVGNTNIAASAVNSSQIVDGTITDADISGTAAIAVTKLATGTNGQVLTVNAGVPSWQNASGLTNPMTTAGDLIYGGVGGTPTRLATGTGFLKGGATPSYSAVGLASTDVTGVLPIANGGTGAATAPLARTSLGLGTLATLSTVTSSEITDGTITDTDISGTAAIAGGKINPNFGAQNIVTTGTLTSGTAGAFAVNATGNITKINNVTTSFPAANSAGVLTNDGTGTLTWASGSGWGLSGNALAGGEKLGSTNGNPLTFVTNNASRMTIDPTGKVGIGTVSPTQTLTVQNGFNLDAADANSGTITNGLSFGATSGEGIASKRTTGVNQFGLDFYTNTTLRMSITQAGNVGIGTNNPASKLDIVGNIKIADGTQGLNKVLTSDANGLASWQPASGSGSLINNTGTRNLFAGSTVSTAGADNAIFGETTGTSNTGSFNVIMGSSAGFAKAPGDLNVIIGWNAARFGTNLQGNTFVGAQAGENTGISQYVDTNSFFGEKAGQMNTIGYGNTFIGERSGISNTTGFWNTVLGNFADVGSPNLSFATAIGYRAMVSQSNSLVLGSINGVNGATASTNVGIGTTAPTQVLDVVGNVKFSGALMPNNLAGTTGQVLTSAGAGLPPTWTTISGGGSVTTVSVTSANGFTGSVATATSTPAITIGTSLTGLLKGNGTALALATAGTDYQAPITLTTTGTSGAATLVGNTLNVPNYSGTAYLAGTGLTLTTNTFSVNTSQNISTLSNLTTNGLIKTSGGTGALSIATAGTDYLTPTGSAAGLTGLLPAQIPSLDASKITTGSFAVAQIPNLDASKITTGTLPVANGGTGLATFGTGGLLYSTGTTNLGTVGNGSAGQMLLITGTTPTWQSMNGDATITGTGAITIAAGAVTGGTGGKITDATITGADLAVGAVDLTTTDVTGTLPIALGGTNSTATPTNGGVGFGTGTAHAYTAAGISGQLLQSNGAAAPTWVNAPTAGWGLTGNAGTTPATQYIGTSDLQPLVFRTNGTEAARILTSGNVGIGTTTPQSKLDVVGGLAVGATYAGTTAAPANGAIIQGNVGIGTSTPASSLHLDKAGSGNYVRFTEGGTLRGLIGISGGGNDLVIGDLDNQMAIRSESDLLFSIIATERMRISSGGNVGIGTTSPVNRLDIEGGLAVGATYSGTSAASTNGAIIEGNVGIGNPSPTAKLDIVGAIKIVDGTQGLNKVLTSDANGLASWATPSGSSLISNPGTFNLFAGSGVSTASTDNAIFGANAGANNTGPYNVIVGANAAINKTAGSLNTIVGWFAGKSISSPGDGNTLVGAQSGENTTANGLNSFFGEKSGQGNTTGGENTFIGDRAGITNTTGFYNTTLGAYSNVGSAGLQYATAIGHRAQVNQSNSLVLGSINGVNGATSNTNVGIGTTAPSWPLTVAANNADYGIRLDQGSTTGNGLLVYANTTSSAQTLLSVQSNVTGLVVLGNGTAGLGRTPTANQLEISGNASKAAAGGWLANSDRRIKTDIRDIDNSLELIRRIRPVKYKYTAEWMKRNPSIKDQYYYSFIAQEYQQVFPEAVQGSGEFLKGDKEEILQIDTHNAQMVTIKAVQEQQKIIETQQQEILTLKKELEQIKSYLGMEAKATKKKKKENKR